MIYDINLKKGEFILIYFKDDKTNYTEKLTKYLLRIKKVNWKKQILIFKKTSESNT